MLRTRKLAVARLPLTVEAASDAPADVKLADAVRARVREPAFQEMLIDLLDGLAKGYSAVELVWRSGADGHWQPEYRWRDPRYFVYDLYDGRTLRIRDEANLTRGIEMPPYKFIVHQPKLKSGLPIRGGIARLAALAYMCKSWGLKDWLAFCDIFGLPLRLGRYEPGTAQEDIEALLAAVAGLGSDAAAVISRNMDIEFPTPPNAASGAGVFQALADWWDKQVSKALVGQTMTSDSGSSRAQAQVHKQIEDELIDEDGRQLAATLNRDFVRAYIDLNFGVQAAYPAIRIRLPDKDDLQLIIDAVTKWVPLGLRVQQSVLRDKLGLPDPDPNADPADLLAPPAMPPAAGPAANQRALNTAGLAPDQASLDEALNAITEDHGLQSLAQPLLGPLLDRLEADGPQAVLGQLAEWYPRLNDHDLQERLARLVFVADVWGRLSH